VRARRRCRRPRTRTSCHAFLALSRAAGSSVQEVPFLEPAERASLARLCLAASAHQQQQHCALAAATRRCLSLEYGISSAAIARNWGDKVVTFLATWGVGGGDGSEDGSGGGGGAHAAFTYGGVNVFSAALQLACMGVVLCGANASKLVVNTFCVLKVGNGARRTRALAAALLCTRSRCSRDSTQQ
jgi:hypothetical protein